VDEKQVTWPSLIKCILVKHAQQVPYISFSGTMDPRASVIRTLANLNSDYFVKSVCSIRVVYQALHNIHWFTNPSKFTKTFLNLETEVFGLVRMHCSCIMPASHNANVLLVWSHHMLYIIFTA